MTIREHETVHEPVICIEIPEHEPQECDAETALDWAEEMERLCGCTPLHLLIYMEVKNCFAWNLAHTEAINLAQQLREAARAINQRIPVLA